MKRKITWKKIAGTLRWQPLDGRSRTAQISHGELMVNPQAMALLIRKNLPFLVLATLAIMILTAAGLFCLPNSYTSEASILPSGTKDNYSALREISGIGNPAVAIDENSSVLFPQILRSRQIGEAVIGHEYKINEDGQEQRLTLKDYFETEIPSYLLVNLKRITTIATDKKTGIITLAIETKYPELSQAIAGQFLDRLEHFNLYKRQSSAKQSAAYLERELSRHEHELAAAEDALEEYQMSNRDWDITRDPEILKTINRMKRDITARMETALPADVRERVYAAYLAEARKRAEALGEPSAADGQRLEAEFADLREALDIDSMDFLNFITAIHHRLGVDVPEIDPPEMERLATKLGVPLRIRGGGVPHAGRRGMGAQRSGR